MEVIIRELISYEEALDCAFVTNGKSEREQRAIDKNAIWDKLLKAEHSPIRVNTYRIDLIGIPYFVSVHFVRHKIGVEHFVKSQRTDRTGEDRNNKKQSALVNHTMVLNAQAIINISRKRLCNKADKDTQKIWQEVVDVIKVAYPTLSKYCVPECTYRGGICPEINPCGKINNVK